MTQQPEIHDIINLAYQAGEILRHAYGKQHQIKHKGVIDLVTETDQASEKMLIAEILKQFPTHTIVAEENGAISGEADHCWFVDPLDGTVNFAHNIPYFSVSIAYAYKNKIQAGVVYDPIRDDCFSAERGKGAFLNGEQITASNTDELINSLLVTGFPYIMGNPSNNNLEQFARLSLLTQGVRRFGSAALDLSYVAAGRIDGYWEPALAPYDIAAGSIIAEEAGCTVTRLDGGSDILTTPCELIAANPLIYPKLLKELK